MVYVIDSVCTKCPEQANPQREEADSWLPGTRGGSIGGVTAHGCRAPFGGDENVLKLDYGKACTMPRQYKNH